MTSSALELSILKLTSPRKRLGHSGRFSFDNEPAQQQQQHLSSNSPRAKAPVGNSAAAPWFADDDLFTIFEQHQPRAAIPFKWEAIPGTRRADQTSFKDADAAKISKKEEFYAESHSSKDGMSDSEEQDNYSTSSPTFSLSPSGSTNSSTSSSSSSSVSLQDESQHVVDQSIASKFQLRPIQIPAATPFIGDDDRRSGAVFDKHSVTESRKLIDEPAISKSGQLMPLKPPPGMHSIKQLLSLESEDRSMTMSCFSSRSVTNLIGGSNSTASNGSAITNLKSLQRRSFRRDGLKALPFISSTPKHQSDDSLHNMLGMEEWSKVVRKQEKQEKQEESAQEVRGHHRTLSMPRMGFPFKKKSSAESDSCSSDTLDVDTIFNEDFGKKGGLREHRPLSSVSSRSFSDVIKSSRAKNWVVDNDASSSDDETVARDEFFDRQTIAEEDDQEQVQKSSAKNPEIAVNTIGVAPKEKRKSDPLDRLMRLFNVSSKLRSGDQYRISHKPARLSSVSPGPPSLTPARSALSLKKASQSKQVAKTSSSSPILKMCNALPFGNALLKNVRQLRSFEFYTPRALASK